MIITKRQLKQIIKEELVRGLNELKALSELDDLGALVGGLLLEGATKDAKKNFNKTLSKALMKSPEQGGINWDKLFKTLKIMPKGKQAHSYRVGGHAAAAGGSADEIIGALMHDYVERGGNLDELVAKGLVTQVQKDIILALSSSEKDVAAYAGDNEPLHHMEKVFAKMDNDGLKNTLAMVKAGDRVDNLNRRVWDPERKGAVTKEKYLKKSTDLFDFLRQSVADTTKVDAVLNRLEPEAKEALANYAPEVYADLGWRA
jgi:hypothetical protein